MSSLRTVAFSFLVLGYAACLSAAPAITGVTNAASSVPPGLPNSGIAQGSIFAVYGSGLGPSSLQEVQSFPLPTTQGLGGTTVKVTVGTVTETCIMFYTVATQVAAVLPSATPVGDGTLTVSYQGASASIAIQVLSAAFGTFTLNEDGTGQAVVTDGAYHPITMINPAHPGDTLVLWGTGLGAVSSDETEPPQSVDLGTGVQVFVGNQPANVVYGGRSGDAGLDQINFTVPAGIRGGCKTSIAVLVKGVVGNVTSMAIAPPGQTTCGDTYGALTAANLQKAVANGSLNVATVNLSRVGTDDDTLAANFATYPVASLIRSYGGTIGPSVGGCVAYELQGSSLIISDPVQPSRLDAGSALVIAGPAGTMTANASSPGSYAATLGSGSSIFIEPGLYSVTNGSGGANVMGFNWSATLPPPVVPTNLPASFNRSQDLTLTWTGGAAFPVVSIFGYAGVPVAAGLNSYVEFVCNADASAGQFTIPSVILRLLPVNGYGATGVPGVGLQVAGVALNDSFTAPGSPGIDVGSMSVFTSNGRIAKAE